MTGPRSGGGFINALSVGPGMTFPSQFAGVHHELSPDAAFAQVKRVAVLKFHRKPWCVCPPRIESTLQ